MLASASSAAIGVFAIASGNNLITIHFYWTNIFTQTC